MKKTNIYIALSLFVFLSFSANANAITLTPDICSQADQHGYSDKYYDGTHEVYMKAADLCRIDLAIQNHDPKICDGIVFNQKNSQLECYTKYAIALKDPSICNEVKNTNTGNASGDSLKLFCFRDYAWNLNDDKVCVTMLPESLQSECLTKIAGQTKNSDICNKIKTKNDKDKCNESLGIYSGSCAGEGDKFSKVYRDQYPSHCCDGLTEWEAGMDTRKIENGKCVTTNMPGGNPVGICIKCGDGVCGLDENVCNCPGDCQGNQQGKTEVKPVKKTFYIYKFWENISSRVQNLFSSIFNGCGCDRSGC